MLQAALKRFQLDYVDLVFCHRPDVTTPIEETVRAMNFVIEQGWAFYWGTSEWTAQQITEVSDDARHKVSTCKCKPVCVLVGTTIHRAKYESTAVVVTTHSEPAVYTTHLVSAVYTTYPASIGCIRCTSSTCCINLFCTKLNTW